MLCEAAVGARHGAADVLEGAIHRTIGAGAVDMLVEVAPRT